MVKFSELTANSTLDGDEIFAVTQSTSKQLPLGSSSYGVSGANVSLYIKAYLESVALTLHTTSVLGNGVTATTQSSSDGSTKVATTAYVDNMISAVDAFWSRTGSTVSLLNSGDTLSLSGALNITGLTTLGTTGIKFPDGSVMTTATTASGGSSSTGDLNMVAGTGGTGVVNLVSEGTTSMILDNGDVSIPNGDLYTVAWTDYGGSATIVGWSSFTTKVIRYKKIGNTVMVCFYIAGASNSTSTSFTLPHTSANTTVEFRFSAEGNDNSVDLVVPVKGSMSPNTNQVNFYVDFASTVWTASGEKAILGEFWYEAA